MNRKSVTKNDRGHKHLRKADPVLAKVIDDSILSVRKRRSNFFSSLSQSIIGQQLSTKAADTIRNRVRQLFKGPGFPTPKQVLRMPDTKLRAAGLSYGKISYIKDLALAFESKKLDMRRVNRMTDEEVIAWLTRVKGIGRWTAEMFLMFSLHRPDIFSTGDLGLRNAVQKLYGLRNPPTAKQLERITAKWSPHRTLASRYLWKSLDVK
jgi:DNA-3-methyladenine glycosylase II